MSMVTRVVFVEDKKMGSPVMFTGLPGIGLVGKITVDYILKQLKAEKVADIYSDSFPPSVHTKEAVVELIRDELFAVEYDGKEFLFLAGPVQPALDLRTGSAAEHYDFAEKIVEAAKKLGVKQIFTLAGINIGDKRMGKQPGIVIAATNRGLLGEFKELGAKADKKEGLISGAAGLILGVAMQHGIEGACIMGETNAKLIYGDHGAAKKLIELIVKKFGFKLDMKDIEKETRNIEKAFEQLAKQFEEPEEKMPKEGPSYVR